jgi:hypothetical protein
MLRAALIALARGGDAMMIVGAWAGEFDGSGNVISRASIFDSVC